MTFVQLIDTIAHIKKDKTRPNNTKIMRIFYMKILTTSIILATSLCAISATIADTSSTKTLNDEQKLGYAMGAETAKSFKEHNIKMDLGYYKKGLSDTYTNATPLMTQQEVTQTLVDFQKQQLAARKVTQDKAATKNKEDSEKFLAENKTKDGVKTLDSGIQYKVITAAPKDSPKPGEQDIVTVDYEGSLIDGTVFDSSYKRGTPATFPLSGVIKGWQIALTQMPVGATWLIYIPSDLAYGENGTPDNSIGANQALIFKVHLISATPQTTTE